MSIAVETQKCPLERLRTRLSVCLLAVLCACAFVWACPEDANAEVYLSDIICGQTVEERDMELAFSPDLSCDYAILIDADGNSIFERDAYASSKIASITKVMTALVALEYGDLSDTVTVSEWAAEIGESSAGLEAGDSMTLETALKALLVPSGNDAAVAIAECIGQKVVDSGKAFQEDENGSKVAITDPEKAFVWAMNEKAKELGLSDTLFNNPHGLDDDGWGGDHHSCAADVAKICQEAMKNDTFRSIVGGGDTTITVSRGGSAHDVDLETTDLLLDLYEYAIGIKTGYTNAAGNCFAGAANKDGVEYYAVILNGSDSTQRFRDAQKLFEWAYTHRIDYKLANSSQTENMKIDGQERSVPVVAEVAHQGWVDCTIPATLEDPDASVVVYDFNGNVTQKFTFDEVTEDVKAGDIIGTVTFKQRNEEVATVNLIAAKDQPAPNIFQSIGVWFDRLIRGFKGEQKVAQSVEINTLPVLNVKSAS